MRNKNRTLHYILDRGNSGTPYWYSRDYKKWVVLCPTFSGRSMYEKGAASSVTFRTKNRAFKEFLKAPCGFSLYQIVTTKKGHCLIGEWGKII
jgi:hypothetical protein